MKTSSLPGEPGLMDDMVFRLMGLKAGGFCCAQIILILALEAQGKTNADLVRSMGGLCFGINGSGEVCGALSGGACLISLYAGKGSGEEAPDDRYTAMAGESVDWFRASGRETAGRDAARSWKNSPTEHMRPDRGRRLSEMHGYPHEPRVRPCGRQEGMTIMEKAYPNETESLCPVCLKRIKATRCFEATRSFWSKSAGSRGLQDRHMARRAVHGRMAEAEGARPSGALLRGCRKGLPFRLRPLRRPRTASLFGLGRGDGPVQPVLRRLFCRFRPRGGGTHRLRPSRGCWSGPWLRQVRATSNCQGVNPPCGTTFRRSSKLRDGSVIPSSRSIRTVSALPQT